MQIPCKCFVNFVAELLHDTFAGVVRIFMSPELVAKVLNMFKNFMRIYPQNYSGTRRTTVIRSCKCTEPVAAKFTKHQFRNTLTNVV